MSYYTANVRLYQKADGSIGTAGWPLAFVAGDTVPDATVTRDGLATLGLVTLQPGGGSPVPEYPVTVVGAPSSGQIPAWNASTHQWEPGASPSGTYVAVNAPSGRTPPALHWDDTPNGGESPNFSFGGPLAAITTGYSNQSFGAGYRPGLPSTGNLGAVTTGYDNTAVGAGVLVSATTAHSNTGVGADSLSALTTGNGNTAFGAQALESTTTGSFGTAVGWSALQNFNSTTGANTAVGFAALTGIAGSSTGFGNTAVGYDTLNGVTTGNQNTAVGYQVMFTSTTGNQNVAIGNQAGYAPNNLTANATTTAGGQTMVGAQAGQGSAAVSSYITCLGYRTTAIGDGSVAIGTDSTGAGAASPAADIIRIGTGLHTTQMTRLAATGPAAPGLSGAHANLTGSSISGFDLAGKITVTTNGSGIGSFGTIITVTFNRAFAQAPVVHLTSQTAGGSGSWQPFNVSTTGFQITTDAALGASTTYIVGYSVTAISS